MDVSDRAGCRWTAEKVAADLVEAFRILPTMPVFSPRRSEFYPVLPGQDTEALDLVAVSERVLGRKSPGRRALLVWARSKATKGDIGGSVSAYCREAGINLQTFNRQRRRACAAIAVEPAALVLASQAAHAYTAALVEEDVHGLVEAQRRIVGDLRAVQGPFRLGHRLFSFPGRSLCSGSQASALAKSAGTVQGLPAGA